VRVATFNIRNGAAADGDFAWPVRAGRFLAQLREFEADVICLQEVLHFQLEEVAAALCEYRFGGVGRDDGAKTGEFVPIFFRGLEATGNGTFWLSAMPDVPGSIDWGARLPRICTWVELAGVTIANVHLDHESEAARRNGVDLLLRTLRADVVCGDFNAEPGERCIAAMAAAGYVDVGSAAGGTFNDFQADPPRSPRIDYVFARNPWGGEAKVARDSLVSDHWPIVADLARCR
jgi:endonuclease/exonuclease/phosphatase family metal-dependent hydrolase